MSGQLSYDHGASPVGLVGCTLGDYFSRITQEYPDNQALVSCHQGLTFTYAELSSQVDLLARGLMQMGLAPGDRVGIWSTNNVEWVITQLATAKVGAILVNINPSYKTDELSYALKQSGVKLLICRPGLKSDEYMLMLQELFPHFFADVQESSHHADTSQYQLQAIAVIDPTQPLPGRLINYSEISKLANKVAVDHLQMRSQSLRFEDPINIQYTSGTTGYPKGVTLTHHNLLNNALSSAAAMGLTPSSRFCVPMPFYHCGGMVLCTLTTLLNGATLVIPSASFHAEATLTAIEAQRCTHLAGVPTMFIAELDHPQLANYDLSSLISGFMAGAPCPVQLMHNVAEKLHMQNVVIFYGQTEASPVITATTTEDLLEKRATTVGRVIPHLELKLVDTASGAIVLRGTQGEICARGYAIMPGYWNNPESTNEAIDQSGWLHTGDLGEMTADGYIRITGRKKDMIIRGGENIYPREIEEVLIQHPAIAQAYVFGVPDQRLGEEVALWVQLKHDADCATDEISLWLASRVARFKVPRYIKQVTDFPMTVTGKIQKFAMREVMIEELGLQQAAKVQTA